MTTEEYESDIDADEWIADFKAFCTTYTDIQESVLYWNDWARYYALLAGALVFSLISALLQAALH